MTYHYTNTKNPIDFPKMKNLYLITYESLDWCGASNTKVVVWAYSKQDAEDQAEFHMMETMRELFSDEYLDDPELEENSGIYSVTSVEEFGPDHEEWAYYKDPTQFEFYPEVGEP